MIVLASASMERLKLHGHDWSPQQNNSLTLIEADQVEGHRNICMLMLLSPGWVNAMLCLCFVYLRNNPKHESEYKT